MNSMSTTEQVSAPLPVASLDQLFRAARTHSAWSEAPVSDAEIQAIYELAKWGPTSSNCNPARYVWVRSGEAKERLANCAAPGNQAKIIAAPVTVIVGRDKRFFERMDVLFPIRSETQMMMRTMPALATATAVRNTTLQGAYLMIAARALGFDCGPMSGFDAEKVTAEFFGAGDVEVDFICSIGHGEADKVFPRLPRLAFAEANSLV